MEGEDAVGLFQHRQNFAQPVFLEVGHDLVIAIAAAVIERIQAAGGRLVARLAKAQAALAVHGGDRSDRSGAMWCRRGYPPCS